MKVRLSVILLIPFVLFSSCRTAQIKEHQLKELSFEHVRDIEIINPPFMKSGFAITSYHKTASAESLWLSTNKGNLFGYDLKTGKEIGKITLNDAKLMSFNYKSEDSIFVFYNAGHNPEYRHDSVLLRINAKGDILQDYSFKATPALCCEREMNRATQYYSYLRFQEVKVEDNNLFVLFGKLNSANNTNNAPISGHFDITTGQYYEHKGVDYPFYEAKHYPNSYSSVHIELTPEGNALYGFAYTPSILEYDLKLKTTILHPVQSVLADTVYPAKQEVKNEFNFAQPKYSHLYYDKYKGQILRFVQQPEKLYGKFFYTVVLMDNKFRTVAEGFFPELLSPSDCFFTEKYLISYNHKKTVLSKNKLIFSVYRIKLEGSTPKVLKRKLKKHEIKKEGGGDYIDFIKEYKYNTSPNNNFAIVAIPYDRSCPTCVAETFKFFGINKEAMKGLGMSLLVSGQRQEQILYEMKEAEILPDSNVIFLDLADNYMKYHHKKFDIYNPRLTIVKNGKIVHDKVYNPSEMIKMQEKMRDFRLEQKALLEK